MKGLIIKDVFNLKKSIMTTSFVIVIYGIFSYSTGNMSMLIVMTALIITSMSVSSMAYDDVAKWDSYALTMPITRKSIVLSKYILSLILCIIATILSSTLSMIIAYFRGDLINIGDIQEILIIAYVVFLISLFYASIIIPLIFKFGVENSRILMLASYFIPIGVVYILIKMGVISPNIEELPSAEQLKTLLYVSPIILIVILIISILISYTIYKKKDI